MRAALLVLVLVFSSKPTTSQSNDQSGGRQYDDAERTVRTALAQFSQGLYTSWTEKELNRLGDASSVALTKVFEGRNLNTDDTDHILAVLTMSFAAPKIVQVDSDRQPRTALFVLKYLGNVNVDPATKKKIADVRVLLEGVRDRAVTR